MYHTIVITLYISYYLDREIIPIPSDTPTIETVSEYLDIEY